MLSHVHCLADNTFVTVIFGGTMCDFVMCDSCDPHAVRNVINSLVFIMYGLVDCC